MTTQARSPTSSPLRWEYALTRLAAAVVEYFLADEALTRKSCPRRRQEG